LAGRGGVDEMFLEVVIQNVSYQRVLACDLRRVFFGNVVGECSLSFRTFSFRDASAAIVSCLSNDPLPSFAVKIETWRRASSRHRCTQACIAASVV
jgi:hypothetical protein